jgi:pseudouridine-5'-phosphate glycosidase
MIPPDIAVSPEVAEALATGAPVVALESTIIAHGMSYPDNVETALAVEAIVRANGAIPCTIAVIAGRLKAGLTESEIERIGRGGSAIMKCSTRELPYAVASARDGATTVASTVRIAALCGITVFATGGIGGVHRNAQQTFDISADLVELSRSPVAVVSAGAKAILDLALTLEILETLAVPVVGFGTDVFPAFYSRDSGLPLSMRLDREADIARMMLAAWQLGSRAGLLVANPIPAEHEIPAAELAPVIAETIREAAQRGIRGKEVTPFLLARLAAATAGRSLAANIALVRNNAAVAARIAVAYADRRHA